MVLDELDVPIVLAPLAGGPATVELAAAVTGAGGLGFLAAGYRTAGELRDQIAAMHQGARPPGAFGVNLFVPGPPSDPATYAEYAERLAAEGEVGEARWTDDDWEAKLTVLHEDLPAVVSFVFGLPSPDVIAALRSRGCEVWVTVTTPQEGELALGAGADVLVAQGTEAGGHRGGFKDDGPGMGTLALVQLLADAPLVAAGGIATPQAVAAVLAAGARAAAAGTAFLLADEAGTSPAQREAVATQAPTRITRAFTGRSARGIVNAFMDRHDGHAPAAYPEVHYLTAPMRAAARRDGDASRINLWAGQAHSLARAAPAAEIVAWLGTGAQAAASS